MQKRILGGSLFFLFVLFHAQAQNLHPYRLSGTLELRRMNEGSKSESNALGIEDQAYGFVVLRIKGDNPFKPNPELKQLVGQVVHCEGFLDPGTRQLIQAQCSELPLNTCDDSLK